MKKKLNVDSIQSELRGGSAFFPGYKGADSPTVSSDEPEPEPAVPPPAPIPETAGPKPEHAVPFRVTEPGRAPTPLFTDQEKTAASTLAGKQESEQASKHASTLAVPPDMLEAIRKIVKKPGKEEVLYVRLSKEEKDKLADVIYAYKRQGIKTSDTEIGRIAVNALLEDYKTNGEKSVLALILESLHA